MQLKTKNRDYNIEFTFEAAESEIVQTVFDYFSGAYMLKGASAEKPESEMTEDEKVQSRIKQMDSMITGIASVPKLTIEFLYMGLLEHHGINGDMSQDILSKNDARNLYKEFCKENPEDEKSLHYGLFEALKEQMETDGFFKRIGLEQMMERMNQPAPKKIPQDHKKKVNTKPLSK